MKRNFSISELISTGCNLMNKNWLIFIVIAILANIVSSLITPSITINYEDMTPEKIDAALTQVYASPRFYGSGLIEMIFYCAMYKMALLAIDGKKVEFSAFNMPIMTYIKYIVTALIVGFIVGVGTLFCIIPGIYLGVRLEFAPIYVIDRDFGIIEAIKASWHDTKGNFWHLLGAFIVIVLFMLSGVLLCCVGAFYTVPAGMIAICVLTRLFSQTSDYEPEA